MVSISTYTHHPRNQLEVSESSLYCESETFSSGSFILDSSYFNLSKAINCCDESFSLIFESLNK